MYEDKLLSWNHLLLQCYMAEINFEMNWLRRMWDKMEITLSLLVDDFMMTGLLNVKFCSDTFNKKLSISVSDFSGKWVITSQEVALCFNMTIVTWPSLWCIMRHIMKYYLYLRLSFNITLALKCREIVPGLNTDSED